MISAIADGWVLRAVGGPVPTELADALAAGVPATVPGVVHTDLLAAGLIPDPYDGANESALAWIGLADWRYSASFTTAAGPSRQDLFADGLDTVASVVLNGREIAQTRNQFREYRWDVTDLLRHDAPNELEITFRSAVRYAQEQESVLGERPHANHHPYNTIRKSACNFGWDWGPDVVTAGIWKPLGIENWSGTRIAAVRPLPRVSDGHRSLEVHIDLEWEAGADDAEVSVEVAGHRAVVAAPAGAATVSTHIDAPDAALWWPRGHGEQPLYDLVVRAGEQTWQGRVGFRSIEIETGPDAEGSPFVIRVNGETVYVRGANWIPDDTFFTRSTRASLARSIEDATAANLNLLRVWGGGFYESDDFYDLCDEAGILVWQDFMLACAAYSEEEPLWSEFAAEARDAVSRIVRHPSLALFNGGNESIWGRLDWGWLEELGDRSWGAGYYYDLFPRIVAELAPGVPYSANSPFSFGEDPAGDVPHPNDPTRGTSHLWGVWNTEDYITYRDHRVRFVSEFGFQGPPAWSTLVSVVHDEPLSPFGEQMLVHQKAVDGNGKLERGLGTHLPQPRSIDDWHWATQLNQARAVAYGIEHFRSLAPYNQGYIVWQLNDCWPVVSWAMVDGHGIRKPVWHALRRVSAERLLTIQPRGEELRTFAHNDSAIPWETSVEIRRIDVAGATIESSSHDLQVAPRSSAEWSLPTGDGIIVLTASTGERAFGYGQEDPALRLDPAPVTATVSPAAGGYVVTVSAHALAKDVTLLADRVHPDARVDSALITLLPGEQHVFRVTLDAAVDPESLTGPLVLRSANDLVAAGEIATGAALDEGLARV
ncbi:glycoside hydrolase family 2 protein [Microbacterium barkeri]